MRTVSLAVALVLGWTASAAACTCVRLEPQAELARSAEVFRGVVERVEQDATSSVFHVRVTRRWKGEGEREVVRTPVALGVCGQALEVGGTYVLYALEEDGELMVPLCSRSSSAPQEVAALDALAPPATESSFGCALGPSPGSSQRSQGGAALALMVAIGWIRKRAARTHAR